VFHFGGRLLLDVLSSHSSSSSSSSSVPAGWWTREEHDGEGAEPGGRDGGGSEAVPMVGRGGQWQWQPEQPAGARPGRGAIGGGAVGARVQTPAAAAQ
jgi:hypothetical protein